MAYRNLSLDGASCFVPNKVLIEEKKNLVSGLPDSVRMAARTLVQDKGYAIHVVDQNRGRCYYRDRVITIPLFAIRRTTEYKIWYLSHEMAHAYVNLKGKCDNHGPNFMQELISICPENAIHHEIGYKPRNAAAAGIVKQYDLSEL